MNSSSRRTVERDGKQFVAVCASEDIVRSRGKKAVLDECTDIAVFRIAGSCYSMSNVCPHQHHAIIADGIVDRERESVVCPMHGWTFNVHNGMEMDNLGRIKTFETFEEDGFVFVEYTPNAQPAWMQSDI